MNLDMDKNKMKIRIIWWCCVAISYLMLGIISEAFNMSKNIRNALFWFMFVIVILSWYIINQIWYKQFLKKVNALTPILEKENNPDKYIKENLELLHGKKSMQIIAILNLNICDAYCRKGDYEKAKESLMNIKESKIYGGLKILYLIDLAFVYFSLNENENAINILNTNRKNIEKWKENEHLGPPISIVMILELIANKQRDKAKELLQISQKKWSNSSSQAHFTQISEFLNIKND